ncbi:hypothetical protein LWI29_018899 [Acer saccharum]|uniref:DUF1985 domain-containing protein n=1 Tax=Acer saccharum TaxID=4024 RepID=A0AA39RH71_ACESA|nr:hypothetical protein LWI29_018899 [Acer saccharum]
MVVDWFRNLIPNNNNSDEDMVKLALILLLEMTLVGKDDRNAIIYWALKLVDDLDAFNKFSWGSFIYTRTFNSLASCLIGYDDNFKDKFNERIDAPAKCKMERYNIYRFLTTFQNDIEGDNTTRTFKKIEVGGKKKELITLEKLQKRLDAMQAQQNALQDQMTYMQNSLMDEMQMGFLHLTEFLCLKKVAKKLNEHNTTNFNQDDNIQDYEPSVPHGVQSPKFVVMSETSEDAKQLTRPPKLTIKAPRDRKRSAFTMSIYINPTAKRPRKPKMPEFETITKWMRKFYVQCNHG